MAVDINKQEKRENNAALRLILNLIKNFEEKTEVPGSAETMSETAITDLMDCLLEDIKEICQKQLRKE